VIDENDEMRVKVFFESIPPSCLSFSPSKGETSQPHDLVNSFINSTVDFLVRSSLKETGLLPTRRGRRAKAPALPQQLVKALSAEPGEAVIYLHANWL